MAQVTFQAFFPTAYAARMAESLIRVVTTAPASIRAVVPPLNGRMWVLTFTAATASQAERFIAPEVRSVIINAINRYDGQVAGNEYRTVKEGPLA